LCALILEWENKKRGPYLWNPIKNQILIHFVQGYGVLTSWEYLHHWLKKIAKLVFAEIHIFFFIVHIMERKWHWTFESAIKHKTTFSCFCLNLFCFFLKF
jgi:hypothetical protein